MSETGESDQVFAAVDLGSNSFHMIVARYQRGHIVVLDRIRELVQLARGFESRIGLHPDSEVRALGCLERFGQRLRSFNPSQVRVAGTNIFRRAGHHSAFFLRAERALGHPIDVVSGLEEARLIYQGVMHSVSNARGVQLVLDIGGGSTEIILGEDLKPRQLFSLHMGCVAFTDQFFPGGDISKSRFSEARLAALRELKPVAKPLKQAGWDRARGSSGTIKSVARALAAMDHHDLTPAGVKVLVKHVLKYRSTKDLSVPGVNGERLPVFVGGLAIVSALFKALSIDELRVSEGSLKDGLLFDLIGRFTHEDARQRSIRKLEDRYHVDRAHANRVQATAMRLFAKVRDKWNLSDEAENLLRWAAQTHEIGLAVTHSRYQQHSAYLLHYSNLPGFSNREQSLMAKIVLSHRRKITPPPDVQTKDDELAFRLVVLLRLAVLLHRSRDEVDIPKLKLKAKRKSLSVEFPQEWLDEHPLTQADLMQELTFWEGVEFGLEFK
ncbi:MAG: Ppx/GppA phosphatase family protein [Pseudomonadota bacterium]